MILVQDKLSHHRRSEAIIPSGASIRQICGGHFSGNKISTRFRLLSQPFIFQDGWSMCCCCWSVPFFVLSFKSLGQALWDHRRQAVLARVRGTWAALWWQLTYSILWRSCARAWLLPDQHTWHFLLIIEMIVAAEKLFAFLMWQHVRHFALKHLLVDESRCATSVVGFDAKSSAETDSNSGAGVATVGLCRVQVWLQFPTLTAIICWICLGSPVFGLQLTENNEFRCFERVYVY